MANARRKRVVPKPLKPPSVRGVWLDAFVDYASGECHLAENTVAAYRRDLKRFLDWCAFRPSSCRADNSGPRRLRNLASRAWISAGHARQASRLAQSFLSLFITGRRFDAQPGRVCSAAKSCGKESPRCSAPNRSMPLRKPHARRPFLGGGDRSAARTTVCNRMPGVGTLHLKMEDVHPDEGYWPLPRQG